MSPIALVLLAAAIAIVVAAEWPRVSRRVGVSGRLGIDERRRRQRRRKASHLRVVHPDHEEFARSVERDLAALPTIDEHDAGRR